MAVLPDANRAEVARYFARAYFVARDLTARFDHDTLKAVVDATDAWIDLNQASYNTALPNNAPAQFRNNATLEEKTLLFSYVAMKRAGIL